MLSLQSLICLLLVFLLLAVAVLLLLFFRAVQRYEMLSLESHLLPSTDDSESFSVLCCLPVSIHYLKHLLSQDWQRYELLLVGDSAHEAALFAEVCRRWALCEVEYGDFPELNVFGVRALYRSRCRAYGRLVLIDRARSTLVDDLNSAAAVATGDWLIPLHEGVMLANGALSLLALEVESFLEPVPYLRTTLGEPQDVVSTDSLLLVGGFGSLSELKPVKTLDLLLCYPRPRRLLWWQVCGLLFASLLFVVLYAFIDSEWGVVIALMWLLSLVLLLESGRMIDPAGRRRALFVRAKEKSLRKFLYPTNIV